MTGPDPAGSLVLTRLPSRATAPDAEQVMRLFPPRPAGSGWPATGQSREHVFTRLLAPPFALDNPAGQAQRRRGLTRMLDWLGSLPGQTRQDRWIVSGAEDSSPWRDLPDRWLAGAGLTRAGSRPGYGLGAGLLLLICGDVIRPGMPWLLASGSLQSMAAAMGRVRDPDAFAGLRRLCQAEQASPVTRDLSLRRIAIIMAAKGGRVGDITAGDCVELCRLADDIGGSRSRGMYFYQLLRGTGVFPAGAPATSRMFITQGQLSPGQMLSRYALACRPVHDLIVDYLREQQLTVDHATLRAVAHVLGKLFWRDLERHHPGIGSLRLAPEVAAGWKQRILVKTSRSVTAAGDIIETSARRTAAAGALFTVRAFYLDIAQWAADDPARWAPWAAPCPIRDGEVPHAQELARRKARMDQRTRERLPALPVLAAAVGEQRAASAARLTAASAAGPGEDFTAGGQTGRRSVMSTEGSARVWADEPGTGKRRDLTLEEHRGFWAWAAVEVLRHSGIRIEELTELSHHSLVQYRLPATGELIPLLQIAPSKTDTERLLVISPELADVLSAIITRIRGDQDCVPLVVAYDDNERQWNPPMPLLFQRRLRAENRPGHRPGHPAAARHRPGPDRAHRRRRPAAQVRAPRFPQDAHHRRDHARDAAAHRPARGRPPRHQHHDGIQSRLPRGSHQRTPGIHRPPPRPAPQPGIPHPHRRRMGGVPRPFRTPAGRARRLRPRLRDQLHPRAQLHQVFALAARPSPADTPGRHLRQPARPDRRGAAARLGRRSRGTESQPCRRGRQAHADGRTGGPAGHRRGAGHAGLRPDC